MRTEQKTQPSRENSFYLHFKQKIVEDRVRQALCKPEGLTPEQEKELLFRADFVEISAWLGSLPQALAALGEFIQYSDSIMNKPENN